MSRSSLKLEVVAVTALVVGLGACVDDPTGPIESRSSVAPALSGHGYAPAPPPGLVAYDGLALWPWTGADLDGTVMDPINLILAGEVDVLSLRAALLALDGNRTPAFPPMGPFNCTWRDAHGSMQATYTNGAGWVANAVQLECGTYETGRFHIRLFDAGDFVVAGVHFDVLIPGSPLHQVLGWDLPEQLAAFDFARTGLLGAVPAGHPVNTPGFVQAIPQQIYNDPSFTDGLKNLFGLPPGPTTDPVVPIPNDGYATVLTFAAKAPVIEGTVTYALSLPFVQPAFPRPFCSQGPSDVVALLGTVDLTVRAAVDSEGNFESHNTLRGELEVTELASGYTFAAQISEIDNTLVGPNGTGVNAIVLRKALPPGVGFFKTHLVTSPNGAARFTASETCERRKNAGIPSPRPTGGFR